jgi:hypothetical protein
MGVLGTEKRTVLKWIEVEGVDCLIWLFYTVQWRMVLSRIKEKRTPWPVVRKRTIPTERPPLVDEVSANFCD